MAYIGSGTIVISGCAVYKATTCLKYKFKEGSKAFICEKARKKGILELIYIKKVLFNTTKYGSYVIVYVDTLNGKWLEDELCTETEAISIATNYWERRLENIDNVLEKC